MLASLRVCLTSNTTRRDVGDDDNDADEDGDDQDDDNGNCD